MKYRGQDLIAGGYSGNRSVCDAASYFVTVLFRVMEVKPTFYCVHVFSSRLPG